ncbi:hypothetical protein BDQ17DRAFT_1200954, partial [Cyathus striatus]
NIWNALKHEKIHLREITIDEPTEAFIQYLSSYTGLRSLVITPTVRITERQSDLIAVEFYTHAICAHASSLEKLEVLPAYEGRWCFGEHNIQTL